MVADGARQLRLLARDLDRASAELRRELPRALRRGARPMILAIQQEARNTLPERGGFADYIAETAISVVTRTGADNASVRLTGSRKQKTGGRQVDLPRINRGRLRHPTYGHGPWVTQDIRAGFWDRGEDKGRAAVEQELQAALDDLRRRIESGSPG